MRNKNKTQSTHYPLFRGLIGISWVYDWEVKKSPPRDGEWDEFTTAISEAVIVRGHSTSLADTKTRLLSPVLKGQMTHFKWLSAETKASLIQVSLPLVN